MVQDRLKELERKRNTSNGNEEFVDMTLPSPQRSEDCQLSSSQAQDVVIEMGRMDTDIGGFLDKVESIRARINETQNDVEKIKELQSRLLDSVDRDEEKETELDRLRNSVKSDTRDLMMNLKEMGKNVVPADENSDPTEVTFRRVQNVHHKALLKTFSDLLGSYQKAQLDYQEKCKLRVRTMIAVKNGNDETNDRLDVDDMLENGNEHFGNVSIFTDGYQKSIDAAKQEFSLVDARLSDLLKVETALRELNDLFGEMSQLITLQGEQIDNIERNVTDAINYVVDGNKELDKAKQHQRRARKKCIIIILILVTVLAIIGISLAIKYGAFNTSE